MTTPQHFETDTQASLKRVLDCIELEPNLWVYKVSFDVTFDETTLPENFKTNFRLPSYQGVTTSQHIQDFTQGTINRIKNIDNLMVGDQVFQECARTEGFMAAWEKHGQSLNTNTASVYDLAVTGNMEVSNLIKMDIGCHMLYDRHDMPLPTAIFFDYMNGQMRNGSYDLDKASAHLSNRSGIHFVTNKKGQSGILEVPYYNNTPSCQTSLMFVYQPTHEEFLTLWPVMQRLNKKVPGIMIKEAMFEVDTLGLRACGAAKYNTYYGCDEEPSSNDEDNDDFNY